VYELPRLLSEYLVLHFAPSSVLFPYAEAELEKSAADSELAAITGSVPNMTAFFDFPKRCAQVVLHFARRLGLPMERALDLGCAVGRSTFELAVRQGGYSHVLGIDFSHSFVRAAAEMASRGSMACDIAVEGKLTEKLLVRVSDDVDRSRCQFQQEDACAMPSNATLGGAFDAVLGANLLCRLPDPMAFLRRLTTGIVAGDDGLVKKGGLLVLTSPCSWLEQFTDDKHWLGGYVDSETQAPITTAAALRRELGSLGFDLIHEGSMPLMIREHARKFQLIVAHLSVWRRRL